MQHSFKFGDRVLHTGKPEWGSGVVTASQDAMQDGKACQRLTIRFERAGVKTLSTAFATLKGADDAPEIDRVFAAGGGGAGAGGTGGSNGHHANDPLAGQNDKRIEEIMAGLPEQATDPFASLGSRLRATMGLYRFSDQAGSLIDWAAAQSGLKDPLSRFNRHELEQFFRRFEISRDQHLAKLASEIRRKEPALLASGAKDAPPAAQRVLRRESAR